MLVFVFFEKVGGVIFILLGHVPIVHNKHIPVDVRYMSIGLAEVLKCSIYDFIC